MPNCNLWAGMRKRLSIPSETRLISWVGGDIDGRAHGGKAGLNQGNPREGGADFEQALITGEAFVLDVQAIEAEGEIVGVEYAGIVCLVSVLKLNALTRELDSSFDGKSGGIGDLDAEFSDITLR